MDDFVGGSLAVVLGADEAAGVDEGGGLLADEGRATEAEAEPEPEPDAGAGAEDAGAVEKVKVRGPAFAGWLIGRACLAASAERATAWNPSAEA